MKRRRKYVQQAVIAHKNEKNGWKTCLCLCQSVVGKNQHERAIPATDFRGRELCKLGGLARYTNRKYLHPASVAEKTVCPVWVGFFCIAASSLLCWPHSCFPISVLPRPPRYESKPGARDPQTLPASKKSPDRFSR